MWKDQLRIAYHELLRKFLFNLEEMRINTTKEIDYQRRMGKSFSDRKYLVSKLTWISLQKDRLCSIIKNNNEPNILEYSGEEIEKCHNGEFEDIIFRKIMFGEIQV